MAPPRLTLCGVVVLHTEAARFPRWGRVAFFVYATRCLDLTLCISAIIILTQPKQNTNPTVSTMNIVHKGTLANEKPANLRVSGQTIAVSSRLREVISYDHDQSIFIATDEESLWVASVDHDGGYTIHGSTLTSSRVPRVMEEHGHATDGVRYYPTGKTRDAEIGDGVVATFHQLKADA